MPFDYAVEADRYDATRGGEERAEAITELVPHRGTLLDLAGSTGIVSNRMAARGYEVAVSTRIIGVLRSTHTLPRTGQRPASQVCGSLTCGYTADTLVAGAGFEPATPGYKHTRPHPGGPCASHPSDVSPTIRPS
jgi:hypothetical protein